MRRLDLGVVVVGITVAALATGPGCSRDAASRGGMGVTGGTGGGSMGGRAGGGPAVPPEIDGQLVINELMAANVLTARDENGAAWPWIEILNPTDTDVPLRGYAVTDDFAMPGKGVIADGPVVPAHGYLTLWLDRGASPAATHVAASLNMAGGVVGLARSDGSFIDRLAYGAQEVDLSASREPDGAAVWTIEWHVSPGAANPGGGGVTELAIEDPETVPAAGDLSDRILGYDQVPRFALTIGAAEYQSLMTAPDIYVPVTLTYDGRDYGPVGVHLKGMQSWEPIDRKPSLHVNIDKFAPGAAFFGLRDLTLNNMHSDFSMMHERIAYWVARQAGVPAPRANHALVTVNGQLYGLYANIETIKKRVLSRLFGNDTGSLFSATDVDFEASFIPTFELVAGPDDRTLLSGLASALTAANPDDAIAAAAGFADVDQFTRFWAMCAVVGQLDSFPYSDPGDDYFAYANPAAGRLEFIPWGIDESFYAGDIDVSMIHSVFAVRCKASPSCYQKFVDNVWDILALTDRLGWLAEHDRVAAQIAPFVAMDTRKGYTNEQVAMYQQDMSYFMSDRPGSIAAWIPPASGAPATGLLPPR